MRVWDIVEMGRHPHQGRFHPPSKKDRAVCERSLELCDALSLRDRSFQELSGGEQQRVLLASALAQTPRVLLLDEPTKALDLAHQGSLLVLLRRLQRSEKLTLVCATHDLNLAGVLLDRVVLLKGGRVLAQGGPKKVLTPGRVRSLYGATVEGVRGRGGRRVFFLAPPREGARR
jgi:iron complex transport system ATP-binding protein